MVDKNEFAINNLLNYEKCDQDGLNFLSIIGRHGGVFMLKFMQRMGFDFTKKD